MSKRLDRKLSELLAEGFEVVGFQHVVATKGTTSDYSILLKQGSELVLYTTVYDGDRTYGDQLILLTGDNK